MPNLGKHQVDSDRNAKGVTFTLPRGTFLHYGCHGFLLYRWTIGLISWPKKTEEQAQSNLQCYPNLFTAVAFVDVCIVFEPVRLNIRAVRIRLCST